MGMLFGERSYAMSRDTVVGLLLVKEHERLYVHNGSSALEKEEREGEAGRN